METVVRRFVDDFKTGIGYSVTIDPNKPVRAYSEDQPRGDDGRWTSEGGGPAADDYHHGRDAPEVAPGPKQVAYEHAAQETFRSPEIRNMITALSEPDGGFTIDPRVGGLSVPEHGFAVAIRGHSSITPTEQFFADDDGDGEPNGVHIISNWLDQHAELFDHDPDLMVGGWHDPVHHEIVLDPSKVVADRDEAVRLGVENNQQSIADLAAIGRGDWDNAIIGTGGTGDRETPTPGGTEQPKHKIAADFNEDDHPRDEHGRFTSAGGDDVSDASSLHASHAEAEAAIHAALPKAVVHVRVPILRSDLDASVRGFKAVTDRYPHVANDVRAVVFGHEYAPGLTRDVFDGYEITIDQTKIGEYANQLLGPRAPEIEQADKGFSATGEPMMAVDDQSKATITAAGMEAIATHEMFHVVDAHTDIEQHAGGIWSVSNDVLSGPRDYRPHPSAADIREDRPSKYGNSNNTEFYADSMTQHVRGNTAEEPDEMQQLLDLTDQWTQHDLQWEGYHVRVAAAGVPHTAVVDDRDLLTVASSVTAAMDTAIEAVRAGNVVRAYSEDQPRDDQGRWTNDGGGDGGGGKEPPSYQEQVGHLYVTGTGTKDDPIKTNDPTSAARALGRGQYVELDQPRTVSAMLDRIQTFVKDAQAAGNEQKTYDLCKATVEGSNLFCVESKGIPRVQMPQLSGVPEPGSWADKNLEKDEKGEVNLGNAFVGHLKEQNIDVEPKTVPADVLKASQNELNGLKVAGMTDAIEAGKMKPAPIFTTKDDYIVDGHHRWAANVAAGIEEGKRLEMPVNQIQAPILEVLKIANDFTIDRGLKPRGVRGSRPRRRGPVR